MITYYKILEIDEDADSITIKKSYRILTKKYHPDLNPDDGEVEEKFKQVNQAYEVLGEPKSREKYDDMLRRSRGEKKSTQRNQEPETQEKNTEQESVKFRFDNNKEYFKDFWGFDPDTNEIIRDKIIKDKKKKKQSFGFEEFFNIKKK